MSAQQPDHSMNSQKHSFAFTIALWWICGTLHGGLQAQQETSPDSTPSQTPEAMSTLSIAEVEAQISRLNDSGLEGPAMTSLQDQFSAALKNLTQAETNRAQQSKFEEAIIKAPTDTERAKRSLAELPTPEQAAASFQHSTEIPQIRKEIETHRAKLTELSSQLTMAEDKLQRILARPTEIGTRLPAANNELLATITKLGQLKPNTDTSLNDNAERMLLLASKDDLKAEIKMLEVERLSLASRGTRERALRELAEKQHNNEEAVLNLLEATLKKELTNDARRLRHQTEELASQLKSGDAESQSLAEELIELATNLSKSASNLDSTNQAQSEVTLQLNALEHDFARVKESMELGGIEGSFSQFLMAQRQGLPSQHSLSYHIDQRQDVLSKLKLASFRTDQKLRDQAKFNTKFSDPSEFTPALELRHELLQKLLNNQLEEIRELSRLDALERAYRNLVGEIDDYLTKKLFWKKSSPAMGMNTWIMLPESLRWTFSSEHFRETFTVIRTNLSHHRFQFALFILIMIGLLGGRHQFVKQIKSCGLKTRRISSDRYSLTQMTLGYSILLAIPLPLVMAFTGWIISQDISELDWLRGIGNGLIWMSLVALGICFTRAICRSGGLAPTHFRWKTEIIHRVRKTLLAIGIVYLPYLIIIGITLHDSNSQHFDSLGRLSFIFTHLWVSLVLFLSLRDQYQHMPAITSQGILSTRIQHLILYLAVLGPIVLVILAGIGYLHTAISLSLTYLATIEFIFLGLVLFAMILRWFVIKERRILIEELLAERRAKRQAPKDPEESSDFPLGLDEEEGMDMDSVSVQTRKVIRSIVLVAVSLLIWWFWTKTVPVDDEMNQATVAPGLSLFDVVKAGLIMWIGGIVIKNLPGLLELAGMRDSSMEPGTRYAVSTIVQYIASAIVAGAVFHILDLDWSSFGWIAAALSVGLGFGLQEVVANFVCGIILLFERPIRVGDVITIDGVNGCVSRIQMRATTITNWDQEDFIVPNKQFITGSLINCTLSSKINRVLIPVGVAYGSDIPRALKLLEEIAHANPLLMKDPRPFTTFEEFGDSSLNLQLRCYLPNRDNRLRVITQLHSEIERCFKEAEIEIPFPQRDLHLRSIAPKAVESVKPSD